MTRTIPRRRLRGLGLVDASFCKAIVNGQILQSQVDSKTLFECALNGYVGVQPSPAPVVQQAAAGTLPTYSYAQSTQPAPASLPAPVSTTVYVQGPPPPPSITAEQQYASQHPGQTPTSVYAPLPATQQYTPATPSSNTGTGRPGDTATSGDEVLQDGSNTADPNAGKEVIGDSTPDVFSFVPAGIRTAVKDTWEKAQNVAPSWVWLLAAVAAYYYYRQHRRKHR